MSIVYAHEEHVVLRAAREDDAHVIRNLIIIAGDAAPDFPLSQAPSGQVLVHLASRRAIARYQSFAVRHSTLVEFDGLVAGLVLGYRLSRNLEAIRAGLLPPYLRPTCDLRQISPASFYVNTLAVFPEFRQLGIGSVLLEAAAATALAQKCRSLSLEAIACNTAALRFYRRHGFTGPGTECCEIPASPPCENDVLLLSRIVDDKFMFTPHREQAAWRRPLMTLR